MTSLIQKISEKQFAEKSWRLPFAKTVQERGIPTTRSESYRYTSLRFLNDQDFDLSWTVDANTQRAALTKIRETFPDFNPTQSLVFVDGYTVPCREHSGDIEVKEELNPANVETARECAMHYLAKATTTQVLNLTFSKKYSHFLNVYHVVTGERKPWLGGPCLQVSLKVGEGLEVRERLVSLSKSGAGELPIIQWDFRVEGKLKFFREQHLAFGTRSFSTTKVDVGANASAEFLFSDIGGAKLTRTDIDATLTGEGASLVLDGVFYRGGLNAESADGHVDFNVDVHHCAAKTTSDQVFKGVLSGQSQAVFRGQVNVRAGATGASAKQLSKSMLLGNGAKVHTRPQLQIDHDDVKCAHGATVGRWNEQELFYLQSRGISRERAESMLIRAFFADIWARHGIAAADRSSEGCM